MDMYDNYIGIHDGIDKSYDEKKYKETSQYYKTLYPFLLSKDSGSRILDIGCGNGKFLYFLKDRGFTDYYGIDLDKSSVDFTHRYVTDKVCHCDAFSFLKDKYEYYDYIFMNEVMEHINPEKIADLLNLIYSSIAVGGSFITLVPNMENPITTYTRWHDFTHVTGFTRNSLKMVLRMGGFSDISIFPAVVGTPGKSIKARIKKGFKRISQKIIKKLLVRIFEYPEEGIAFQKRIFAVARKGNGSGGIDHTLPEK